MFPSNVTSQKRKNPGEYFDPAYVYVHPSPKKKLHIEDHKMTQSDKLTNANTKLKIISDIIALEFQEEIKFKKEQLEEIDSRLERARTLLDRLRYIIVADYYKKQELCTAARDITAVRGKTTLFENEANGPQRPQHPSLKNTIGKRPTIISEAVTRPFPERVAAQNALNTLRARSQSQKRQERRMQKVIREQGLVIDHSKEADEQLSEAVARLARTKEKLKKSTEVEDNLNCTATPTNNSLIKQTTKALNTARLNNKTKQFIVIGNTSTYIGAEKEDGEEHKTSGCTHKWLVYVQSKDSYTPVESFIRKVRFHLHPSFRPNDILDVRAPPFQIARRGWGEFPMRIQLFFHDHINQKPVQLIHHLVLDRTLSGLQTLGAETLMEIWLRTDAVIKKVEQQRLLINVKKNDEENEESTLNEESPPTTSAHTLANGGENTTTKHRTISFTQNKEELDDKLLGIVNKKDIVPTDITKIEPSVVVDEPLTKISTSSLNKIICKESQYLVNSPVLDIVAKNLSPNENLNTKIYDFACLTEVARENAVKNQSTTTKYNTKNTVTQLSTPVYTNLCSTISTEPKAQESKEVGKTVICNKSMQLTIPRIMRLPTLNLASTHNLTINKNKNNIIALSRVGKLMPLKAANVAKMITSNTYSSISAPMKNINEKAVLQKKLVQLIDAEGKIKFMQVLVATTQKPLNLPIDATESFGNTKNDAVVSVQNAITTSTVSAESAPLNKSYTTITENDGFSKRETDVTTAQVLSTSNQIQLARSTPNDKIVASPKQVIFQKEGKLFIIDPLQMKLKQERPKQVSLLKPKKNLLGQRQQQDQVQKTQSKAFRSMISDHDYTSSLNIKDCDESIKLLNSQASDERLSARRPRAASEILEKQRIKFEKDFLDQNIQSMRSAVEHILRRFSLIAPQNTFAAALPFVKHSFHEFDALPALKQRACEWLRAKYVSRFVRTHKLFKKLQFSDKEKFWSTREILVYARHHAFTPRMKSFDVVSCLIQPQASNSSAEANSSNPFNISKLDDTEHGQVFSQFIKNEIKFKQEHFQYESITHNYRISSWLNGTWKKLMLSESNTESSDEPIDIVSIPVPEKCAKILNDNPQSKQPDRETQKLYLPIPEHLEESSHLVSDICRDLNIRLQPEQIEQDVIFPLAKSVVAQCLKMFVEKLMRRAVASKCSLTNAESLNITPQDIGKVLMRHAEFDFLTNKKFGAYKYDCGYK